MPGGHRVHATEPARLYSLYCPTAQRPVHAAVASPLAFPNKPAGQAEHNSAVLQVCSDAHGPARHGSHPEPRLRHSAAVRARRRGKTVLTTKSLRPLVLQNRPAIGCEAVGADRAGALATRAKLPCCTQSAAWLSWCHGGAAGAVPRYPALGPQSWAAEQAKGGLDGRHHGPHMGGWGRARRAGPEDRPRTAVTAHTVAHAQTQGQSCTVIAEGEEVQDSGSNAWRTRAGGDPCNR